jgi:Flp pilus assembly protein TadG
MSLRRFKDKSHSRRDRRCGRWLSGQSIVEMGLLVPFITLLLVASGDWGRVFFARMELIGAARAGAAYGAQNHITAANYTTMQTTATSSAPDIKGVTATASSFCTCLTGGSITCSSPGSCTEIQLFVQVDTYATFNTLLHYPGVPTSVALHATAILPVY